MARKKRIGKNDLRIMAKALKPGEGVRVDYDAFDKDAREMAVLAEPPVYLGQVLRSLSDPQAIKHAADILSRQLEIVLQKRGALPARGGGPFSNRIKLVAKVDPPALDGCALKMLRELNSIYIHFHDGTLQTFDGDDDIVECIDRLIPPPPPELGVVMPLKDRVAAGIVVVSSELDRAGGHSRNNQ